MDNVNVNVNDTETQTTEQNTEEQGFFAKATSFFNTVIKDVMEDEEYAAPELIYSTVDQPSLNNTSEPLKNEETTETKPMIEKDYKLKPVDKKEQPPLSDEQQLPSQEGNNANKQNVDENNAPTESPTESSSTESSSSMASSLLNSIGEVPLFSQAKEFLSDTFEDVKDAIGLIPSFPQAKTQHKYEYLNDVATGNWKLHPVETDERTELHHLGMKGTQKLKVNLSKGDRRPIFRQVLGGVKLNHVETVDKSVPVIPEDFELKFSKDMREDLLEEIEHVDKDNLKKVTTIEKDYIPEVRKVRYEDVAEKTLIQKLVSVYDKVNTVAASANNIPAKYIPISDEPVKNITKYVPVSTGQSVNKVTAGQ